MIINIKNKMDLITIDLRCKQIRYLRNIAKHGEILFLDLSNSDKEGYEYLFKDDLKLFKDVLKEDLKSFLDIDINIEELEVIK